MSPGLHHNKNRLSHNHWIRVGQQKIRGSPSGQTGFREREVRDCTSVRSGQQPHSSFGFEPRHHRGLVKSIWFFAFLVPCMRLTFVDQTMQIVLQFQATAHLASADNHICRTAVVVCRVYKQPCAVSPLLEADEVFRSFRSRCGRSLGEGRPVVVPVQVCHAHGVRLHQRACLVPHHSGIGRGVR